MKQNKGSALFVVILTIMILSILGVAFLTLSIANAKTLAAQDSSRQAYYLARSGADAVSNYIRLNPQNDTELIGREGAENDDFPNGTYKVEVIGSAGNLEVKGTGNVNGTTRTSTAVMRRMRWEDIIDKALFSTEDLNIEGMNVTGDVQSAGDIAWRETGNHAFSGDADRISPKTFSVSLPSTTSSAIILLGDITLTGHDTKTITSSAITSSAITTYQINNISIEQQSQLTVKANNCEINLIINQLSINNIFSIEVIGNGKVNIYITGLMVIKTSGYINNTQPSYLHIYLMNYTKFIMQANITLNGYIIGPFADVEIQSSNSIIRGAVVAETITKNGSGGPNGDVIYIPERAPLEIPEYLKGYIIYQWKD